MSSDESDSEVSELNESALRLVEPSVDLLPFSAHVKTYNIGYWEFMKTKITELLVNGDYTLELSNVLRSFKLHCIQTGVFLTEQEHEALLKLLFSISTSLAVDTLTAISALEFAVALCDKRFGYIDKNCQLSWKLFEYSELICTWKKKTEFFPNSAIQEIWEFYRPSLFSLAASSQGQIGQFSSHFKTLRYLLPYKSNNFNVISEHMLPSLFKLWYTSCNMSFQVEIITLFSSIVRLNSGKLDWRPHLCLIFDNLLDFLNCQLIHDSYKKYYRAFSTILLDLIPDDRQQALEKRQSSLPGTLVKTYFESFVESYDIIIHPSSRNNGAIAYVMLIDRLVTDLQARVFKELVGLSKNLPPLHQRMTPESIDWIIDLVLPQLCDVLMFSPSNILSIVSRCVKKLASLRPAKVLPKLLATLYEAKDRPDMPLRLKKTLQVLQSSVTYLISPGINDFISFPKHLWKNETLKFSDDHKDYINSHLDLLLFPTGRSLVPNLLKTLSEFLDINKSQQVDSTCQCLHEIFTRFPLLDISSSPGTASKLKKSTFGLEEIVLDISQKLLNVLLLVTRGSGTFKVQKRISKTLLSLYRAATYSNKLQYDLFVQAATFILSNDSLDTQIIVSNTCIELIQHNEEVIKQCMDFVFTKFKKTIKELKKSGDIIHENEADWNLMAYLRVFTPLLSGSSSDLLISRDFTETFIEPLLEILEWLLFDVALNFENSCSQLAYNCIFILINGIVENLLRATINIRFVDLYRMKSYNNKEWSTYMTKEEFVQPREGYTGPMWFFASKEKQDLASKLIERFTFPLLDRLEATLVTEFHKLDSTPHEKEVMTKNYIDTLISLVLSSYSNQCLASLSWHGSTLEESFDYYANMVENETVPYDYYEDPELFKSLVQEGKSHQFNPKEFYKKIFMEAHKNSFICLERNSLDASGFKVPLIQYLIQLFTKIFENFASKAVEISKVDTKLDKNDHVIWRVVTGSSLNTLAIFANGILMPSKLVLSSYENSETTASLWRLHSIRNPKLSITARNWITSINIHHERWLMNKMNLVTTKAHPICLNLAKNLTTIIIYIGKESHLRQMFAYIEFLPSTRPLMKHVYQQICDEIDHFLERLHPLILKVNVNGENLDFVIENQLLGLYRLLDASIEIMLRIISSCWCLSWSHKLIFRFARILLKVLLLPSFKKNRFINDLKARITTNIEEIFKKLPNMLQEDRLWNFPKGMLESGSPETLGIKKLEESVTDWLRVVDSPVKDFQSVTSSNIVEKMINDRINESVAFYHFTVEQYVNNPAFLTELTPVNRQIWFTTTKRLMATIAQPYFNQFGMLKIQRYLPLQLPMLFNTELIEVLLNDLNSEAFSVACNSLHLLNEFINYNFTSVFPLRLKYWENIESQSPIHPRPGLRADNQFMALDTNSKIHVCQSFIYRNGNGFAYFTMFKKTSIDTDWSPHFPRYKSGATEGVLDEESIKKWLEQIPNDANKLRHAALRKLVEIVAKNEFWEHLANSIRLFHIYASPSINAFLKFIKSIKTCCGPHITLPKMDHFFDHLLPLKETSPDMDGIVEFVSPFWVTKFIYSLISPTTVHWDSEDEQHMLNHYVPRWIVKCEAVCLLASLSQMRQQTTPGKVNPQFKNIAWVQVQLSSLDQDNSSIYTTKPVAKTDSEISRDSPVISKLTDSAINENKEKDTSYHNSEIKKILAGDDFDKIEDNSTISDIALESTNSEDLDEPRQNKVPNKHMQSIINTEWTVKPPLKAALLGISKIREMGGPRQRLMQSYMKLIQENADACFVPLYNFGSIAIPNASQLLDPSKGCVCDYYRKKCTFEDPCPVCILHIYLPPKHRLVFLYNMQIAILSLGKHFTLPLAIDFSERFQNAHGDHFFDILSDHSAMWFRSMVERSCQAFLMTDPTKMRLAEWIPPTFHSSPDPTSTLELYHKKLYELKNAQLMTDTDLSYLVSYKDRAIFGIDFFYQKILPKFFSECRIIFRLTKTKMSKETREIFSSLNEDLEANLSHVSLNDDKLQDRKNLWLASTRLKLILTTVHFSFASCLPWLPIVEEISDKCFEIGQHKIRGPADIIRVLSPLFADLMTEDIFIQLLLENSSNDNMRSKLTTPLVEELASLFSPFFMCIPPVTYDSYPDPSLSRKVMGVIKTLLDSLDLFLQHTSWKVRAVGIILLKRFTFMHAVYIWPTKCSKNHTLDLTIETRKRFFNMFLDEINDVREVSLKSISDLMQYGYYQDQAILAENLMLLSQDRPGLSAETSSIKPEKRCQVCAYGICALILSSPYSVPSYLPNLISTLVLKFTSEGCPWRETARQCLASFRKTHQDNWEQHALSFSTTQLDDLLAAVLSTGNYV